jgi:hypothetical protein
MGRLLSPVPISSTRAISGAIGMTSQKREARATAASMSSALPIGPGRSCRTSSRLNCGEVRPDHQSGSRVCSVKKSSGLKDLPGFIR